ncbi:MAG TPA: TPM domain-containing protein, partial [Cyclobacteriaceae bacterium]
MKLFIPLILLLFPFTVLAQTYTVETVPDTKLGTNSYVSNPDGIISEITVEQINVILDSLEKKTTAQVSVVLLNSIGNADVFDFAQQLFEKWGIGQKGNSNGLLILFVMDKRTVRFHTGDGLEGVLPDATCKDIQREYMVPHFKDGNYSEGMLQGVEKVAAILTNPEAAAEIIDTSVNADEEYYIYAFIMLVLFPVLVITFFIARARGRFKKSNEANWIGLSVAWWLVLYLFFPFTLLFIAFNFQWGLTPFMFAA